MSLTFIVQSTISKLIASTNNHVSSVSNYSHSDHSYCCSPRNSAADGSINVNQLTKTEKSNSISNKFQWRDTCLQISTTMNAAITKNTEGL